MPHSNPPLAFPSLAMLVFCVGLIGNAETYAADDAPSSVDQSTYLSEVAKLLRTDWPKNRKVNIVCHGHSVPAGYFKTPEVRSLDAYPHLLRVALAERYPHAVINVIVTAIGGENSEGGARRFDADVLSMKPDVVTMDYALNDRAIGLERAAIAWTSMIERAVAQGSKVILLTPTPDLGAKLDDENDPLNQHAKQIRELSAKYHVGLADSLRSFRHFAESGGDISSLMSQGNHPNRRGHELVSKILVDWFR